MLTIEFNRHSNKPRRNVSDLNFRMVVSIKRWGSVNFFIFDENFNVMFSDNCGRKFARLWYFKTFTYFEKSTLISDNFTPFHYEIDSSYWYAVRLAKHLLFIKEIIAAVHV